MNLIFEDYLSCSQSLNLSCDFNNLDYPICRRNGQKTTWIRRNYIVFVCSGHLGWITFQKFIKWDNTNNISFKILQLFQIFHSRWDIVISRFIILMLEVILRVKIHLDLQNMLTWELVLAHFQYRFGGTDF